MCCSQSQIAPPAKHCHRHTAIAMLGADIAGQDAYDTQPNDFVLHLIDAGLALLKQFPLKTNLPVKWGANWYRLITNL